MISEYFGIDKYSFYMILLKVWIIGLIYISLMDESRVEETNVCFWSSFISISSFFIIYRGGRSVLFLSPA